MAVGGLPTPLETHATAAADLAMAMQQQLKIHEPALQMRVGLCTGPVVAGVIGSKKFAYDLWGDTVNLASRMESLAPAGGILVAASTYECLRDQFDFHPGSVLSVKGKGQVLTYQLLSRRSPVPLPGPIPQ
jgi:class 3 adenylate cyclase